jgi:hypothetical protein
MSPRNLIPGQYQIGNLLMGRGTTVRVEEFKVNPYDVNAQDYQVVRADEINFGWDQLKPTTIEIKFHILNNFLLPGFEAAIPNFWSEMPTRADFQREWRFDEGRYNWGLTKELYVCDRNGLTKTVYGRPGQFTYGEDTGYVETVECLGEFRRADTLSYAVDDNVSTILTQALPTATINGTDGDAASWLKIFLQGPIIDPVITIDGLFGQVSPVDFGLNRTIAADEIIEINGEPWQRRIVSTTGENIAADFTNYLDKLRFYCEDTVEISLAGTGMTSGTKAIAAYRDAYQVV